MTTADHMADDFELAPPDKLALHHRQQLSAMLDGELSPDQAKFMLRRLQHDDELASCWERWQVCGDMLRGRGHALLPADFAQRIARAIAHGDEGVATPGGATMSKSRIARWGGSAALAASVAAVAFFVARQLPGDIAPAAEEPAAELAAAATDRVDPPTTPSPAARSDGAASFEQAAAALASAAAVAEVPRRAAERRSRAQNQRAASRSRQRAAQAPALAAASQASSAARPALAAAAAPSVATPSVADGHADPFATQVATPERPWPRAILPGLSPVGGGFVVSTHPRAEDPVDAAFAAFEPRLQPVDPVDANADPADSSDGVAATDSP